MVSIAGRVRNNPGQNALGINTVATSDAMAAAVDTSTNSASCTRWQGLRPMRQNASTAGHREARCQCSLGRTRSTNWGGTVICTSWFAAESSERRPGYPGGRYESELGTAMTRLLGNASSGWAFPTRNSDSRSECASDRIQYASARRKTSVPSSCTRNAHDRGVSVSFYAIRCLKSAAAAADLAGAEVVESVRHSKVEDEQVNRQLRHRVAEDPVHRQETGEDGLLQLNDAKDQHKDERAVERGRETQPAHVEAERDDNLGGRQDKHADAALAWRHKQRACRSKTCVGHGHGRVPSPGAGRTWAHWGSAGTTARPAEGGCAQY